MTVLKQMNITMTEQTTKINSIIMMEQTIKTSSIMMMAHKLMSITRATPATHRTMATIIN